MSLFNLGQNTTPAPAPMPIAQSMASTAPSPTFYNTFANPSQQIQPWYTGTGGGWNPSVGQQNWGNTPQITNDNLLQMLQSWNPNGYDPNTLLQHQHDLERSGYKLQIAGDGTARGRIYGPNGETIDTMGGQNNQDWKLTNRGVMGPDNSQGSGMGYGIPPWLQTMFGQGGSQNRANNPALQWRRMWAQRGNVRPNYNSGGMLYPNSNINYGNLPNQRMFGTGPIDPNYNPAKPIYM